MPIKKALSIGSAFFIIYHLLKLGHAWWISTSANHGNWIASLITSLSSANLIESADLTNWHPAAWAIASGSKGDEVFPWGVVFVFAQSGVVGLAWPVVSA